MTNNSEQNIRGRIYRLAPIVISLIVLIVSSINLYLNLPIPNLEVGMFPVKATVYSPTIRVNWTTNSANQTVLNSTVVKAGYTEYNFTYQVYNSGKGIAHNVNVSLTGEPFEDFEVISTSVFVGEPLRSNLLDVVHSQYQIGLLGAGKSYTFLFLVQVRADNFTQGGFILKVTSDNAGTFEQEIVFR